jgi:hypothetical protein
MIDRTKRISWWQVSVLGGLTLSLVTLVGVPIKLVQYWRRHGDAHVSWTELVLFPLLIFGMGFLCGTVVWALQGLPRRLGPLGDAITGLVVMVVFFLCCMLIFDPAMLQGRSPGRGFMLMLGSVVGLVLGAWVGRDLRRELATKDEQGRS